MRAIRVSRPGGPEVLEWQEVPDPEPGEEDVVVETVAAGVNFIDTYHRSGLYPMPMPFTPGMEGSGRVVAVGAGCHRVAVGDVVAWSGVGGSYAELVRVPEARTVAVPAGVPADLAAAALLQGLTAHYLVTDTFPLGPGQRCLIHAAAGGVGLILVQLAKHLGAEVFATVGSTEKVAIARSAGADHVIVTSGGDVGSAIEAVVGPRAIDVVYDGVGKAVFDRSLDVLRPRGMMVTFGNASGPVDPVAPLRLMQGGSLFLTRPNLADYIATRAELEARCDDLFRWIADGVVEVRVGGRFALCDAADAHRAIESRGTVGKLLLVPSTT